MPPPGSGRGRADPRVPAPPTPGPAPAALSCRPGLRRDPGRHPIPLTGLSPGPTVLYAVYLLVDPGRRGGVSWPSSGAIHRKGLFRPLPGLEEVHRAIPSRSTTSPTPCRGSSGATRASSARDRCVFLFHPDPGGRRGGAASPSSWPGRPAVLAGGGRDRAPRRSPTGPCRKRRSRERKPRGLVAVVLDWVGRHGLGGDRGAGGEHLRLPALRGALGVHGSRLPGQGPALHGQAHLGSPDPPDGVAPSLPAPAAPGDVVTIANPRYPENHRVDLKKHVSQFVYMVTLTAVHLDSTLPDGTPKADPLVKRITGVPGEKLMMVDDILYARRKGDAGFRKVEEPWAATDLWKQDAALRRRRIQQLPLDEADPGRSSSRVGRPQEPDAIPRTWRGRPDPPSDAIETALDTPGQPRAGRRPRGRTCPGSTRPCEPAGTRRPRPRPGAATPSRRPGAAAEDLALALAASVSSQARAALRAYAEGRRRPRPRPGGERLRPGLPDP
ncbi:MAG: hypothetical protein M0C28_22740 [Candidatus Moduliflexus flocculans]|nr:hypothetical protein [Candidatus Moduliflexus flocculans]